MRNILIFLFFVTFSIKCLAENTYKKTITVSTLKEFIQALDNDTEIIIDAYEMDMSVKRLNLFIKEDSEKVKLNYDLGLQLNNFRNLKIRGAYERTSLFVKEEEEIVLTISNSSNIVLENLNLYHKVSGYCYGQVLEIEYSENIEIYNCGLNGSGRIGLEVITSNNIKIEDSEIFNNSDNMISIRDSYNISFSFTRFFENSTSYSLIDAFSSTLSFYSCIFEDNYTEETFVNPIEKQDKKTKLYFKECTFDNIQEKQKGITPTYAFFSEEYTLDFKDYLDYWKNNM